PDVVVEPLGPQPLVLRVFLHARRRQYSRVGHARDRSFRDARSTSSNRAVAAAEARSLSSALSIAWRWYPRFASAEIKSSRRESAGEAGAASIVFGRRSRSSTHMRSAVFLPT